MQEAELFAKISPDDQPLQSTGSLPQYLLKIRLVSMEILLRRIFTFTVVLLVRIDRNRCHGEKEASAKLREFLAMSFQFIGKTAIITGAGGAIGRSYALELAKRGCNVIVNDLGASLTGGASAGAQDPAGTVGIFPPDHRCILTAFSCIHISHRQGSEGDS